MKPTALLRLIRPVNCLMMGFAVIVGSVIAAGADLVNSWPALTLGFVTTFTLTGSAMSLNDYFDRSIDAINEPKRPIPSGEITLTGSIIYASILAIVGMGAAYATNLSCLALAIFALTIMILYSAKFKRSGLLGNLMVSTSVALPFLYGGLAVRGTVSTYSLLFALMAFLSNTGREITKGIVDIEGDRAEGVRTVAVLRGPKKASQSAAIFYVSAVFISVVPVYLGLVSLWYFPAIVSADLGFIVSSFLLIKDPSREKSRTVKNRALIWMMLALVGFFLGSVF